MINFGAVPAGAVLPVVFDSYAGSTGASVTLTGLAVTDVEVYKGTSMTQRASDAGYVLIDTDGIDIDGITGIHGFSIDTGDNTDAGFYAVGSFFTVVVSAVTIDSQTVNFVAATFRLMAAEGVTGMPKVDEAAIRGDEQSAIDLKDFADAGYDPGTNKVQGVVLTDTVTTYTGNTVQTGDNFARLGAPAGASVSADIAAVKVDTAAILVDTGTTLDARIPAALVGGRMDASVGAVAANAITAASMAADAGAEIADAVWDEALAGHVGAGSAGEALSAAGTAGDPWTTALPGAYGAGTAGKIVGDNINATVSSRATPAQVATELATYDGPTFAELDARTDAIDAALVTLQADTDNIQTRIPAALVSGRMDASVGAMAADVLTAAALNADAVTEIQSGLATAAALTVVDDFLDTEIAAIKAKTDLIPAAPAAVGDVPTATQNADALLKRDMSAVTGEAARSPLNALRKSMNKVAASAGTLTVYKEDDTAAAFTQAIGTDAAAVQIVSLDTV